MLAKIVCVEHESLLCHPASNKLLPILLNKDELTLAYALLHQSYKKYYSQQSLDNARQTRKYLQKHVLLIASDFKQKTIAELQADFKIQNAILKDTPSKTDKKTALLAIAEINRQVIMSMNNSLAPIAANDYERSVALYLATEYRHQEVQLNVPIWRHDKYVKEFDAIIRGEMKIVVEEKMTLGKHDLRNIFDCDSERKASHIRILNDTVVQDQNDLKGCTAIHIIFSELDEHLLKSGRSKKLRLLKDTLSVTWAADKFIDMFDGDIKLHRAKQTLHALGIKTVILTRIDQEKMHPNRWSILG